MPKNEMSPARTLFFVLVPFAAIPAAFIDFVPALFLRSTSSVLCFWLIGILFCVWLGSAKFFSEDYEGGRIGSVVIFFRGPVIAGLLLGAVFGWLFWLIFAKEFGSLMTGESGDPYSEVVEMRTNYYHRIRKDFGLSCDYTLKGGPMVMPSHLCINEGDYNDFPDQVVSVRLTGKKSWMGKTIARFYIENKKTQ